MRLILIEGVPGCGKSTLAESLHRDALSSGVNASWYLEESRDHPVHPHIVRNGRNLAEYYLRQWEKFISENASRDHLFILEESLFQSTIRFMVEADKESMIPEYFTQCQLLLSNISSDLIYLQPANIRTHIDWISTLRGEEWTRKVTKYLEATPFCIKRGWFGENCMGEFWSYYADVCDLLVKNAAISSQAIASGKGNFESQLASVLEYTKVDQRLNKGPQSDLRPLALFFPTPQRKSAS